MEALTKEILSILSIVGVNQTVYYQLAIFIVGYSCLYFIVFKPYFRMFEERERSTVGNQDRASQIIKETQELEVEYQVKARQVNEQYKKVYDKYRAEAMREYDEVVSQARSRTRNSVETNKKEIQQNMLVARKQLLEERPQVSNTIVHQILGGGE